MARQFAGLILLVCAVALSHAGAQEKSPDASAAQSPEPSPRLNRSPLNDPEILRIIESLPPEKRDQLKERIRQWERARFEQRRESSGKPGSPRPMDSDEGRRLMENLPPEQRQKFKENFEHWQKLSPDERKFLREHEQFRREKVAHDIDEAIKELGLNLDEAQRKAFTARYAQERRKIEEQLRHETDEKRKSMTKDVLEKLKTDPEFAARPAASPAASP